MTTDEIIKKLEPWLTKHRRPAWKPVVEDVDDLPTASKFSGTPWIGPEAAWPECGQCKNRMQLFLQLNLGDLPTELGKPFGTGLLQLFYCTRNDCEGGWEPFGDDLSRVRVVQPTGNATNVSVEGFFPAKRIIDWKRIIDLPKPSEHDGLGLKYIYDHKAGTVNLACEELGLVFEAIRDHYLAENIASSEQGDKLAGWPAWVQGVEYPACPRCGLQMIHVFQVDSEVNIPFMFGDVGCGHVTQCPEHKDVVAFGWACQRPVNGAGSDLMTEQERSWPVTQDSSPQATSDQGTGIRVAGQLRAESGNAADGAGK